MSEIDIIKAVSEIEDKKIIGSVYFIKDNSSDSVKIGMSSHEDPIDRYNSFLTYAPNGGVLIGYIKTENPSVLESFIHEKYKERIIQREWFNLSIKDSIDEISLHEHHVNLLKNNECLEYINKENDRDKCIKLIGLIKEIKNKDTLLSLLVLISQNLEIDTISEMARKENKTPRGIRMSNQYQKINIGKQVFAIKGLENNGLPF